jgi:hypothetical protein
MLSLYILSAVLMLVVEYFILLQLYQRSKSLQTISLIVAPLLIILAIWITSMIQGPSNRLNLVILFIVIALLELPLSLYGYEITPNASVIERMLIAGVFGTAVVLIAEGILSY